MANALGMASKGVELSNKRCRRAIKLQIKPEMLDSISPYIRNSQLDAGTNRVITREAIVPNTPTQQQTTVSDVEDADDS
jgi:hypothetical protein